MTTPDLRAAIEDVLAKHATGTHRGHDRCIIDAVRDALAADTAPLDLWPLMNVLHETAPKNHNLGEGPLRAICDSIEAHGERAERIAVRLAKERP